ncbi:MAG: hypothetical protein ABSA18_13690 [Dehalococcoidia bacterium]
MAMVKKSSSRYEQKRISRLESGIRAAQHSGISSEQINQLVGKVFGETIQDTEEGSITRLDVDNYNGEVLGLEQAAVKVHRHVVLPVDTYTRFEGKRSQRFSRPVAKIFLDHPERLKQYNILRDHRFSRFMAIDIIKRAYFEKRNSNGGHEDLTPKAAHPLDLTTQGWQTLIEGHKASFTRMHEMKMHEGLSHLQATNSVFKEMDHEYRATNGQSVFGQIDVIPGQVNGANKGKYTSDFKAKERNPELKRRYYKRFQQKR